MQILHFNNASPHYQTCLNIRLRVLREPLGMQITPDDLERDKDSIHILAWLEKEPAGTVSLRGDQLRQMAVLPEFRGYNVGKYLVRYLEGLAKTPQIWLEARENAIKFYEKQGYVGEGDFYEKIGIKHLVMKKTLWIF